MYITTLPSKTELKDYNNTENVSGKISSLAKDDAKNGKISIYPKIEKDFDEYKEHYKSERKKVIKKKAFSDASQMYKFEHDLISFKPVLQGTIFTIPAEVALYQEIFLKEKSKLQEKWERKNKQHIHTPISQNRSNKAEKEQVSKSDIEEVLDAIYEEDKKEHIEPKDFYKYF